MNFLRFPKLATPAACLLALAGTATAAYPGFSTMKPNGAQRGTDAKVTITGERLDDFEGMIFMSPGFTQKSVDKVEKNKVELTLGVGADIPPGYYMMRVRTKSGISHMRPFFVGQFPNAEEKEPNNDFEVPQPATLNTTVEGLVTNEDVDYYKVTLKKGERLSLEVDGLRLGYVVFDPYIAVLNKDRFEVANSDDTILHRQDGFLTMTAPEDGDYTIMVRESSYRGAGNNYYRLHIGNFRRPEAVYPSGGKIGSTTKVRFIDSTGESFEEDVKLPADTDERYMLLPKSQGAPPSGNPFRVSAFDNTLEAEPNNDIATATTSAGDPIALNGIISEAKDVDFFKIPLKKGMRLDLRCYAQTLGSPLDPVIGILNEKGGSLGNNDDGGGLRRLDSKLTVNIPADGNYFIRVTDHLERGGPTFVYRLEVVASEPELAFSSPEYSVNDTHLRQFVPVPRGGRYATLVNISRNNVSGDYKWTVPNLPPGVKLLNDVMPGNLPNTPLVFEAAADAPLGGVAVPIKLTSVDPAVKTVGKLRQEFDMVRSGNVRYYSEIEDQLPIAAVEEAPYSLEIVKPAVPLVAQGLMDLKVVAKRKEGFKAPIRVFMMWKPPGISSLGEATIAEGQNECSFTLDANANVAAGKWNFVVMGEAEAGNGRVYNASPFCEVTTVPAFMTAPAMALAAVEQGKETELTCKLDGVQAFNGDAQAEVVGVPDTITIESAKINKDTKEVSFKVKTNEKSPVGKQGNLFVMVKVPVDGGLTTHRIAVGSTLRIDKPRPAPAAAPAAPAVAANTKPGEAKPAAPAAPKPLSRLEQLRAEAQAKK
ncbi:pre-peptidase [Roseimicrobium gellanilyticum]|uniref:Pre-peptidase n=1 Tax=Roseimicrobium gellanilyticum TaxID=748857 RepID=A0A366HUR3_9BACT|nr:PPC domain-containing protein [Roseimicrobium gellanilyticum]RBP48016.1 pre-peptidase [Roseimicrobium gellanilyticum]